jgi:sugar phosphate permease
MIVVFQVVHICGMPKAQRNPLVLFLLIVSGEAIFFLPFVLPRIFRPSILSEFNLTNLELGSAFSVYGIVAIVSYFFGGPLADRFSPRILIASALCLTAFGGSAFLFEMTATSFLVLYGYWGFTTIFLLWAAMIKATRLWGGMGFQGRAFGLLEGGRGLTAALIGLLALGLLSSFSSSNNGSMRTVILASSALIFLIGLAVAFFMPSNEGKVQTLDHSMASNQVSLVLKNPLVWLQGLLIVFAYVGYKMTDDFSLYANEVLGFSEVESASIGTAALWLRPLFAVLAGFAADRFSSLKVIAACFLIMIIGGAMIAAGFLETIVFWVFATMVFTVVGIYGLRGVYFAVIDDLNIPVASTGTAVGVISVLGYTPDVFISPVMGYLLDTYPGAQGHQYVFMIIAGAGLFGLLTVMLLNRLLTKE